MTAVLVIGLTIALGWWRAHRRHRSMLVTPEELGRILAEARTKVSPPGGPSVDQYDGAHERP